MNSTVTDFDVCTSLGAFFGFDEELLESFENNAFKTFLIFEKYKFECFADVCAKIKLWPSLTNCCYALNRSFTNLLWLFRLRKRIDNVDDEVADLNALPICELGTKFVCLGIEITGTAKCACEMNESSNLICSFFLSSLHEIHVLSGLDIA